MVYSLQANASPITFKVFNDNTHIVAIKTTGNVYSFDAVDELNIRSKYWKDLLSDTPFTRKDIITIQDPHNLAARDMSKFDFVTKGLKDVVKKGGLEPEKDADPMDNINAKGSMSRILEEMKGAEKPKTVQVRPGSTYDSLPPASRRRLWTRKSGPKTQHTTRLVSKPIP